MQLMWYNIHIYIYMHAYTFTQILKHTRMKDRWYKYVYIIGLYIFIYMLKYDKPSYPWDNEQIQVATNKLKGGSDFIIINFYIYI